MGQTSEVPWATLSIGAVVLAAAAAGLAAGGRVALPPAALTLAGFALAALRAGEGLRLRFPAKWLVLSALGLQLHLADPVAEARGDAAAGKR